MICTSCARFIESTGIRSMRWDGGFGFPEDTRRTTEITLFQVCLVT
uniref:Uncharacterized protein n=1 Tax=Arundo donax TaxID=35708 RepID=A0A0A9F8K8_ARUDO